MQINQVPSAILLCREARIASFLWGHRGLGKSDSHKILARSNGWGFIDLRGSQLEASDLRGLPKAENGLTRYLPPSELPQGHSPEERCPACSEMTLEEAREQGLRNAKFCKGLFFLDEINRAEDDVLQAIFQLVLDRQIGEYELPEGWSVHCAGNFGKGYNTNNFKDPAFLDRFCHLTVATGDQYLTSWIDWMSRNAPGHDKIIQFVSSNEENLTGDLGSSELGFSIEPSPRSWFAASRVLDVCEEQSYPHEVKLEVLSGLVGSALAPAFERFSCEISPAEVINDGVGPHETTLNKLTRNAIFGLTHGIISKCVNTKASDLGREKMENVASYMIYLCNSESNHRDMAVAMATRLVGKDSSMSNAMIANPMIAQLAKEYGKKLTGKSADSWMDVITGHDQLRPLLQKATTSR